MTPVNRIKRWPFPGNSIPAAMNDGEELRVDGAELLSVYGALTSAIGRRDGRRVFEFLKRLATEAARKHGGGIPCISFHDAMGEFASILPDGDEEIVEDDEAEPGCDGDGDADEEKG